MAQKSTEPGQKNNKKTIRKHPQKGSPEWAEENLSAVPGSLEGGTLAGQPGILEGGHWGKEPQPPDKTVPPYGLIHATPFGTPDAILGTTTGDLPEGEAGESVTDSAGENEIGSTLGGRPAGMTGHRTALKPEDLYSTRQKE